MQLANAERGTDDPRVHAIFDACGLRNIVVVPILKGEHVFVAAISAPHASSSSAISNS